MSREVPGWTKVSVREVIDIERAAMSTDEIETLSSVALFSLPAFDAGREPETVTGSSIKSGKNRVPRDCVLFSKLNPRIPRVWRVRHADSAIALCSTEFWPLTAKSNDIDLDFVAHFLGSPVFLNAPAIKPASSTNSHQRIDRKAFERFEFSLPPVSEQRRIAEILSSVDEAIQATQAVIEQTRKVKQGVLKRLLTKGIGHTRFKQTEIGEIPEEWRIEALPELLREPVRNGYSPICPKEPTGKWLLSLGALTPDGFSTDGLKPAPLNDPRLAAANLVPNDILISRSNTPERVGMVGMYLGEPTECYFPDLMMRIRFNTNKLIPQFGAAYLANLQASGFFAEIASGTSASMVKINRGILAQILIPIPSIAEQEEIVCRVEAISEAEKLSKQQLGSLEQTKIALMADLLTGHKRVLADLPMAAE